VGAYSALPLDTGWDGFGLECLSALLGAVAHPRRLALVAALARRELCASDLVDLLGLPQPLVSHHLAAPRQAGVVRDRRDAHWVYYSLAPEALAELRAGLDGALGVGPPPPQARYGAAACPPPGR
jgi:ArsR family transcriptional regulator